MFDLLLMIQHATGPIHEGSSVESGFEPITPWLRGRYLTKLRQWGFEVFIHVHGKCNVIGMAEANNDVKTAAENWFNGQGRGFYQAGINKLVLRSDKCLNRCGDNVEK
ncbi:hypothetical protein AVEN_196338-1 [Araneus ventricosus]|uniref:Uncharacterized protein n=1 Tax=Araneus ventricosus TaxID=182803 RepID=A0A4Y2ATZ1_ARAVE|nr:hypothetical protein AVEN_196338-1 [Araneus ventricosus]